MPKTGRPRKEFNHKLFCDLIGLGCGMDEICWMFRDENDKPANIDTLSRWCKREFGLTFQEYRRQNGAMYLKIQLRRNQLELSKRSAAMAIFLGKQYLGQKDAVVSAQDDPAAEQISAEVQGMLDRVRDAAREQAQGGERDAGSDEDAVGSDAIREQSAPE